MMPSPLERFGITADPHGKVLIFLYHKNNRGKTVFFTLPSTVDKPYRNG
jgi:hypothetical protein